MSMGGERVVRVEYSIQWIMYAQECGSNIEEKKTAKKLLHF